MSNTADQLYEDDAPALLERSATVAGHLLEGATAFFFLSFLFAYVYLRELNNDDLWHPKRVHAPVGWGTAVACLLVASAVATQLAAADERRGRLPSRVAKLAAALGLGAAALGAQAVEWATIDFGPADGGYASVFVGWTGFLFLITIAALVWVEIQLATVARSRATAAPGLRACASYWNFLAATVVLTWVVLYLVHP